MDAFLSAQGPDIQSDRPDIDIEVKSLTYWHRKSGRPQPASAAQLEKDLLWVAKRDVRPRYFVLFLPRRAPSFAVQRTTMVPVLGRRRFQHCLSVKGDLLNEFRLVKALTLALADPVRHSKTNGETSIFFQHKQGKRLEMRPSARRAMETVGDPDDDLIWALVIESRRQANERFEDLCECA